MSPRVVGWIGVEHGCFGWLRGRIQEYCRLVSIEPSTLGGANTGNVEPTNGDLDSETRLDRLVVASPDRLTLPAPHWLDPCVPTAIAASSWWEGSSRTGLRSLPVPTIAWHRWWDGWLPWLEGSQPLLYSGTPPRLIASLPLHATATGPLGHGWVVANCPQIADVWTRSAMLVGHDASWLSLRQFEHRLSASEADWVAPDWLLWDDTCLDSWRASDADLECVRFFRAASRGLPNSLRLAALSMPRWDLWKRALSSGAQELISKPNTGGAALGRAIRGWRNRTVSV